MLYIKGKFVKERSYTTKTGFEVRQFAIESEKDFLPTIVSVPHDAKYNFKEGDIITLPVRVSAWSDTSKKFTPNGVVISAVKE